ncbi:MAG TPA: PH domain-containing protein [Dehalococcoidia bacterium]|nr:PH domain-containing protein [Dehalococcoidia bacterium]
MSAEPAPKSYGAIPFPLQGGEMILQLVHRHWWYLWPRTILFLIVAIVPVIIVALLLDAIGILDDLGIFFWIVAILWIGYWGVRGALNWYRYANDIWVVTNQRIIDSFKPHPFSHHLATADLVNVQDISVDKIGFIATILKFGDVVCQTASAGPGAESFRIIGIPNPETVQLLIDRERDRERNRLSGPGTATTTV